MYVCLYIYIYICNVYMYLYVYTMDLTLCPHRRSEDDPKKDSFSMVPSQRKLFKKIFPSSLKKKHSFQVRCTTQMFHYTKALLLLALLKSDVKMVCPHRRSEGDPTKDSFSFSMVLALSLAPAFSLSQTLSFARSLARSLSLSLFLSFHLSRALSPSLSVSCHSAQRSGSACFEGIQKHVGCLL